MFGEPGIRCVLEYWRKTGLHAIFLPEFAGSARALSEAQDAMLRSDARPIEKLKVLDRLCGGRLRARLERHELPESYVESLAPEAKDLLEAFQRHA